MKQAALRSIEIAQQALESSKRSIDADFERACCAVLSCRGRVVVSGLGKSGHIGKKISATLASTGTPSLFVHASEAPHGDFGMIQPGDILICISYSGSTREVLALLPYAQKRDIPVIAMTGNRDSQLARHSDFILNCRVSREADPNNLAPTTSALVTLSLGDALAIAVMDARNFTDQDYAQYHPGGTLGKKLAICSDVMRPRHSICTLKPCHSLRDAIVVMRSDYSAGIAHVINDDQELLGVFTDGDLRRLCGQSEQLDLSINIQEIMTSNPVTTHGDSLVAKAFLTMQTHHVDNLPVVDLNNHLIGMIDIQDIVTYDV